MSELMFTGWQVVGCAVMCFAAGVGLTATGIAALKGRREEAEGEKRFLAR